MKLGRREVWHDPAMGMAGVFRPLKKKAERDKLDVEITWGLSTIRWRSPDQLGISDQSVLFAVLEAAAEQLSETPEKANVQVDSELWPLLGHQEHVFRADSVQVVTTYSRLARYCGWGDGGPSIQRVKDGLRRMTETTVWVRIDDGEGNLKEGSSRLLAWRVGDHSRVELIVNWRLAQALRGGQYTRISLTERLLLKTEVAQALHVLLSSKVNLCNAWSCRLDRLQVHVWGNAVTGANLRARRMRLRLALAAIGQLRGWLVTFQDEIVRVSRGPAPATTANVDSHAQPKARSVVSVTPRQNSNASPAVQSHSTGAKASTGAGCEYVDLSVLFSTRE